MVVATASAATNVTRTKIAAEWSVTPMKSRGVSILIVYIIEDLLDLLLVVGIVDDQGLRRWQFAERGTWGVRQFGRAHVSL